MLSDWCSSTIGDEVMLQRGIDITRKQQRPGPVPVVSSGGVKSFHDVAHRPGPGVVLGRKGTLGKVFFLPGPYWPHDTTLWVRDFKGNDPRFVFYFFQNLDVMHLDVGSANPTLNRNHVHPIEVLWPPLDEQRRIAAVLGALDEKIELHRKMNKTLEEMAQAIFKSWFIDFDGHTDFVDSELGRIPRGWAIEPVRDCVEALFDGPHATPKPADEGPIFLGIKNLTGTGLNLSTIRRISEEDWPRWTKRVVPAQGDIVFCYEARLGDFAILPPGLRCCLGRRMALIRPEGLRADRHYLFHFFVGAPFQEFLRAHINPGSTVDRILLKDFPGYPVLCPPASEVEKFERMAATVWCRIHNNQAETRTLTDLRDTLLPKLISGEIRVPEAEAQMEMAI